MLTLLIVESDHGRAVMLASMLSDEWTVIVVRSYEEVLTELRANPSVWRILCANHFEGGTAAILHAQKEDELSEFGISLAVMVWGEDQLGQMEEMYLGAMGVEVLFLGEAPDKAVFAGLIPKMGQS